MYSLGFDPDPSFRGEGSSTGLLRPDDNEPPLAPVCKMSSSPAPPSPEHVVPPIRLRLVFRSTDPSKEVITATISTPRLSPTRPDPTCSDRPPKRMRHVPEQPRRPLQGGGKPRRGRGRGGATASESTGGGAAARVPRSGRRATRSRRTSATPTTLESIAAESKALRAEVKRLHLQLRDVIADGNCLFRALGDQVWGEQGRHAEVRQMICDELARNEGELRDFVAGFLIEGEEYSAYVDRMRGLGVYGSHIELVAATKVFKRSIRVVLAETSYTVEYKGEIELCEEEPEEAEMTEPEVPGPKPRRQTRSTATGPKPIPRPRAGHTMLWLGLFSGAEHYESVRRQGPGASSGPADVPDSLVIPHERDQSEAAQAERAESGTEHKRSTPSASDAAAARFIADGRVAQVVASLPPWNSVSDAYVAQVLVRTEGDISKAIDIIFDQLDSDGEGVEDARGDTQSDTSTTSTSGASAMLGYRDTSGSPLTPEGPSSQESTTTDALPQTPNSAVSTAPTSPLSNASDYDDKDDRDDKDYSSTRDREHDSDRVLRSAARPKRGRPRRGAGKM
ncbi:uncharacterized protein CcaverHIS019_0409560 [Cutaneotrichosporon cavernicola]|uniref:OTU domain-containing protein n=1 Tax=Cutaneotrichosporon cavernicola TaxID=279322 RepID=A0AA48L531_9TREE|nr:uncharacterized protein CcaverHIS019_0409560 [Cutaneotrichosporon cavernicola]BEI92136.1 hypothetical protein CcaverHIS019_0409560 [Cutaneotrichosporon cavernicola]BEI99906.1 hypothetical protein CcaverHIS631_0409490 [Cutaneotrichosporon cavernicola]BEJ07681.1 hypothetical protein CcaverHIS641_0409500 [Cutaneotrichosporon cavernicola]